MYINRQLRETRLPLEVNALITDCISFVHIFNLADITLHMVLGSLVLRFLGA